MKGPVKNMLNHIESRRDVVINRIERLIQQLENLPQYGETANTLRTVYMMEKLLLEEELAFVRNERELLWVINKELGE